MLLLVLWTSVCASADIFEWDRKHGLCHWRDLDAKTCVNVGAAPLAGPRCAVSGTLCIPLCEHHLNQNWQACLAAWCTWEAAGKRCRSIAPAGARVFADVDDTLKCSGGAFVKIGGFEVGEGVDTLCRENEVYPGAGQFMQELIRGPCGESALPLGVTLLSARPNYAVFRMGPSSEIAKDYPGLIDFSRSQYGFVSDFFKTLWSYEAFGITKFRNWIAASSPAPASGPAYAFRVPSVFLADDGQGDVVAARLMLNATDAGAEPGLVTAFIHHVTEGSAPPEEVGRRASIVYFSTYADAAFIAAERGLISEEGFYRVIKAVQATDVVRTCSVRAQTIPPPRSHGEALYTFRCEQGFSGPLLLMHPATRAILAALRGDGTVLCKRKKIIISDQRCRRLSAVFARRRAAQTFSRFPQPPALCMRASGRPARPVRPVRSPVGLVDPEAPEAPTGAATA